MFTLFYTLSFPSARIPPVDLFTVQMTFITALLRIGYEVQQHLRFPSFEYLSIHVFISVLIS